MARPDRPMPSFFEGIPKSPADEVFQTLAAREGVVVERIVSDGHASPDGFWYDQDHAEWVMIVRGGAVLRFEDPAETVHLRPGSYLLIDAHRRHRVESTEPGTLWLAIHFPPSAQH